MTLQALSSPVPIAFTHGAAYATAPVIQVEIAAADPVTGLLRGRSIPVPMLVDSGADVTAMDDSYAGLIGINLAHCPTSTAQGFAGPPLQVRHAKVLMRLCGRWLDVPVLFSQGMQTQLLGRQVVFDNLLLAFAQGRNAFYAARM